MSWPQLVSGYVEKPHSQRKVISSDSSDDETILKSHQNGRINDSNAFPISQVSNNIDTYTPCPAPAPVPKLEERKNVPATNKNDKYGGSKEESGECIPPPVIPCPKGPWPDRLIMSPPQYGDLGKQARDVFGKGYHFGLLKLDIKTKTNTGVEFSTGGVSNRDTGKVFGSLESKYKFKDYGITFTERWNTDNVLATDISLSDFCEGAKVSLDTSFAPHTGDKSVKIKAEFKNDVCALNLDTDFKHGGPVLRGSAVMGYCGWLLGYLTAFDASKSKLIDNKLSMGFVAKDFVLNTSINDGRVFSGSIFHKVNPTLETGVQLSWSADNNDTDFGIGCRYSLDKDASLRFKVNNQSLIGLGYQQKLKEGVTVYLSAQIDGKNFNEGGHKIGFALELEA